MAIFSAYFVQGYYGLSLALPLDYEWTYGIGHSQPLQTIAGLFVDTGPIYDSGLLAQLQQVLGRDQVSRPTVYRALNELVEAGLLVKMDLGGRAVYEHDYGYPNHDHLHCTTCNRLIEFKSDDHRMLSSQVLDDKGNWNRFVEAHYRRVK